MHSISPTPKMLDGLRWFKAHEPIGLFGVDAPSRVIRKRLQTAGWIIPIERLGRMGFLEYRVTDAGAEVLNRT